MKGKNKKVAGSFMDNLQTVNFKMENDSGELVAEGQIHGESVVPFQDDLKFKAIIALLNSIDKKNFREEDHPNVFNHYISEIEETLQEIKKHDHFQGNIQQS